MKNQDHIYQAIHIETEWRQLCTVPFTGDANFSESEVVDRLLELFGEDNVEIISGISSIQIAEAKSRVPLDKKLCNLILPFSWKKWNLYFIS